MANKAEAKKFIEDLEQAVARGEVSEEEGMKMLDEAEAMIKEPIAPEEKLPSFSARIGASPFEGMMNAITESNRKAGATSGEQAEMMKQGLMQAADIGTGAALVRGGVGELAGGSYMDSPEALLKSLTEGVPTDILEKNKVLAGSPKTQWLADALLNTADPGMVAGVGGLLKQGIKSGGKSLYRSGLKNIDKAAYKAGKELNAFSDTAMKYGIAGTSQDVLEQSDEVLAKLLKEREDIFKAAAQKGAVVDADKVLNPIIRDAEKTAVNKKIIDSNVKKEAAGLAEDLKQFSEANKYVPEQEIWKTTNDLPQQDMGLPAVIGDQPSTLEQILTQESGGLSPAESSGVKTQLYNMLGGKSYENLRRADQGEGLLKRAASRFNTATTAAVRKVDPKAAKRVREINKDMAALLTGRPAAQNEMLKEITVNAITSVDAPMALLAPQAFLGKKAADLGKTALFRTQAGKALSDEMVSSILGGAGAMGAKSLLNAYKPSEQ